MAIAPFLAMTAAEMYGFSTLPPKIAWMACHFSPYGLGLSNLPKDLPSGSLLMVDDITPPHRHDPQLIAEQLSRCVDAFQCAGVLLDFQNRGCEKTQSIAEYLTGALPCLTVVSDGYARDLDCPVFLPSVPLSMELCTYLEPWKGREIWLEAGLDGEILTLTEEGCEAISLPCPDWEAEGFSDDRLHCHYTIETTEKSVRFTLWRTTNDLEELLAEAEALGVVGAVGLYQELGRYDAFHTALPKGEGGSRNG